MKESMSSKRIIKRTICMTVRHAKALTVTIFLIGIIQSLASVGIVVQTTRMVDSVSFLLKYKGNSIHAVEQVVLLAAITIIAEILNALQNMMYEFYINRMRYEYGVCINQKARNISPILYEDPSFLTRVEKAKEGMESSIEMLLLIGDFFTYYLPYFIFMGIYLAHIRLVFPLFILAVFAPTALSQVIRIRTFSNMEDTIAPMRRKLQHYSECVSDEKYIKETRILNIVFFFKKKYNDLLVVVNSHQKKARLHTNLVESGLNWITLIGYLFILITLFQSLRSQIISIGQFAGIYASISTMFGMMEDAVRYNVSYIFENIGIVQNYFSFMDTDEVEVTEKFENLSGGIQFNNVSFIYPGSEKPALDGISFDIKPNETIAIVGANGSGKSTLLNLILGLYHPTKGSICIDGEERSPHKINYLSKSAVFQRFQKYKMTAKENIWISDVYSKQKIDEAASLAGVTDLVKENADRVLATEFSGVDLSIGQWQRMAIARATYKENDMIALDEPTAAIDPIEENELYKQFEKLSQKRLSVIVTHHLGSIRFSDRILVLDKGKIVDIGTHEELMKKNGLYSQMYGAQSEQY